MPAANAARGWGLIVNVSSQAGSLAHAKCNRDSLPRFEDGVELADALNGGRSGFERDSGKRSLARLGGLGHGQP
jgi:hypothetical protein